jgi:membrane fusion protein (multidrug efflux system)
MTATTKSAGKTANPPVPCRYPPKPVRPFLSQPIACLIRGWLLILCIFAASAPAAGAAEGGCIPVETTQVAARDLQVTVRGIGTLEAIQQVMIRPEVHGVIESVHFEEGSPVEQGELLFRIEDDKIQDELEARQAALDEAKAGLENAESVYRRRQRLFKQELGTEEARDEARARFKSLKARVKRLQAEIEGVRETLSDTRVTAPFDGIIGERQVDPGEWVDVGTPLAPLVQIERLKIAFTVPEKFLGRVKTQQPIKVRASATPEQEFTGRVYFVSPMIREDTRSVLVKAYIENPEKRLSPGGFAAVDLILDVLKDRPVIPEEALVPTRTGYMVFLVEEGAASGRNVRVGLRQPGIVEIKEGLKPGQTVIQSGHIAVQDGARVCDKE